MVERTGYIPLAMGDVMRGRVPKTKQSVATKEFKLPPKPVQKPVPELVTRIGKVSSEPAPARQVISAAVLQHMRPDGNGYLIPLPSSTLSYRDYEDPVPAVREELRKLGVDSTAIRFERYDDEINNPGGRYTNRLLRVEVNGKSEDFSVELTLRNPRITAVEIGRLLGVRLQY